jgi:hypothetical protein
VSIDGDTGTHDPAPPTRRSKAMSRNTDTADMIIDPSTLDADTIARLVAKGRHERSMAIHAAFRSAFKGLFGSSKDRSAAEPTLAAPHNTHAAAC